MTERIVVVIGAGVIGLTTAITLQEKGYAVFIIAKHLPGDPMSLAFTSPWAGAHHLSSAEPADTQMHEFDREGFSVFHSLLDDPSAGLAVRPQFEYRDFARQLNEDGLDQIALLERYQPNFRMLTAEELPAGVLHGASFDTINIDVPVYLKYLVDRFRAKGGTVIRAELPTLTEALSFSHPDLPLDAIGDAVAVFNCTGLSALSFVPDENMFPVRGERVLVRAPWVKVGITYVTQDQAVAPFYRGYVIPRNATDIVVGGTVAPNDWDPNPRPETTRLILERGLAMCPELLAPDKRAQGKVEDMEVLEVGVGLRPARKGGIRLEVERREKAGGGASALVVHNYGHGGAGYQSSWGSARAALSLLQGALAEGSGPASAPSTSSIPRMK